MALAPGSRLAAASLNHPNIVAVYDVGQHTPPPPPVTIVLNWPQLLTAK